MKKSRKTWQNGGGIYNQYIFIFLKARWEITLIDMVLDQIQKWINI